MRLLPNTDCSSNSSKAWVAPPKNSSTSADTRDDDERVEDAAHVRKRMDLAVSDGGDGGQHHVEAVEPRPAFDEVESGDADEDQCQQREEEDLQIEQGLHSSHCVASGREAQQKRPSIREGRIAERKLKL